MPFTRLFLVTLICTFCSTFSQAQSFSNNSDLIRFEGARAMGGSENSAAKLLQTDSAADISGEKSSESEDVRSRGQKELNGRLFDQNGPHFIPGSQFRSDNTCLFIRDYRMVRDDPHSDSTHRDGYTTCVPAARLKMYSTVLHQR